MYKFQKELNKKILKSLKNNFGQKNYDVYRFGEFKDKISLNGNLNKKKELKSIYDYKKAVKNFIKKILYPKLKVEAYLVLANNYVKNHTKDLDNIWNNISSKDRKLMVSLIAFRVLGYKKVKLSRNNKEYWDAIEIAKSLANHEDTYNPNFIHYILKKFDLKAIGYDTKLYFTEKGIAVNFIIEQYAYKINATKIVAVEKGDTVLDIGACWGDTALYFATNCGVNGHVYSFEFIPDNLKLFHINTALNPKVLSRITLVESPVSNRIGETIYFKDHGPSSKVSFTSFDDQTGTSTTISIDDFVRSNGVTKIDFIKMDIEGAEPKALEGAIETLKKFKPKLAIAIYHNMDDFATIPNWILSLDLGYKIYIGHYTIHSEETICFAKI
jgi:FkbM family methyltransferase